MEERLLTGSIRLPVGQMVRIVLDLPFHLALFLAALNEQDRYSTAYDLKDALFDAGYILQPLQDMAAIEFLLSERVIGQY